MNFLVVTSLTPRWAGNQSLTRTLNGLAAAGHRVHVLRIGPPADPVTGQGLDASVTLHYRRMIPGWMRPAWVLARSAVYAIEKALRRRRRVGAATAKQGVPGAPSAAGRDGYVPAGPETWTLRLVSAIGWLLFQPLAVVHGAWITRRERIDLLYGYEVYGAPAALMLGFLFRRPVATRFQGTYLSAAVQRPRWWLSLYNLENALALKVPARLVIMGDDGTRGGEVLTRLGVPQARVMSLTNGVDFGVHGAGLDARTLKADRGLDPDGLVLLTVSHLKYWKRLDRVVDALPPVVAEMPGVTLVMVGDGAQRQALESQVARLGVREHARFVGAVPHAEVKTFVHMADVFLSVYDLSNRSNSVLEAMVCGKCIVTLDDGSVSDLIIHGETGMLVSPSSVEDELPRVIVRVLRDEALRRRMGDAARARAHARLMSVEERMRVEVEALEALVAQRPARAGRR